jgi:hypothetical protein
VLVEDLAALTAFLAGAAAYSAAHGPRPSPAAPPPRRRPARYHPAPRSRRSGGWPGRFVGASGRAGRGGGAGAGGAADAAWVVQEYVDRPLLYVGGRKFDIRCWVRASGDSLAKQLEAARAQRGPSDRGPSNRGSASPAPPPARQVVVRPDYSVLLYREGALPPLPPSPPPGS